MRIHLSVTNDLTADQRMHRISQTLYEAGNEVQLTGCRNKFVLKIESRNYKTFRLKSWFSRGFMFYAEYNIRLFFFLLFKKVDVVVANDLDTLFANFLISKIKRIPLVYDSHEYYTELPELVNRYMVRKIWLALEKWILPKIKYSYTVCESIANIYRNKYGIDMKVIRNIPTTTTKTSSEKIIPEAVTEHCKKWSIEISEYKIIIYQGTVNIGRGLDYMVEAMKHLDNKLFIVVGDGDILPNLVAMTKDNNLSAKILFVGKVPFEDLFQYTKISDLGVSLEENIGLNYYYALPNKLFDYIRAGIPVLASPLPEIKRVVNKYQIGRCIEKHDGRHIADRIDEIFANTKELEDYKINLQTAASELTWENEKLVLLSLFWSIQ